MQTLSFSFKFSGSNQKVSLKYYSKMLKQKIDWHQQTVPVLLINDGKAQVLELYCIADEGMCAYDEVHAAILQPRSDLNTTIDQQIRTSQHTQ